MNLYLDDNTCKGLLVALLGKAGHQTIVPADAGTAGIPDAQQFLYAIKHGLVILTRDHNDFEDLHYVVQATQGQHPGILAIRSDNDTKRDMKDRDIVRAIAKLVGAGVTVANEFHVLNHWR
jgi:predicted nuclease of predicted toxin-antitoxin system